MFASCRQLLLIVACGLLAASGGRGFAQNEEEAVTELPSSGQWWIEVVTERELPVLMLEARKKAAEAEAARLKAEAEKKAEREKAKAEKEKAAAEKAKEDAEKAKKEAEEKAEADKPAEGTVRAKVKELLEGLPEVKELKEDEKPSEDGAEKAEDMPEDGAGKDAAEEETAEDRDAKKAGADEAEPMKADPEKEETTEKDTAAATDDEDKPKAPEDAAPAEGAVAIGDAAEAEEADQEPAEPKIEKLSVTIAMAGEVTGLDNTHLLFRPTVQPERELRLKLTQVSSLSRHAPGKAPEPKDPKDLEFRVVLRDGSEVPGQLMSLSDVAITVAMVGSGAKIDLPIGEITRVERNNPVNDAAAAGPLPEMPGRHLAALSTGEVLSGQLLPSRDSDKWLRISSPILTAECPLSLIDLLIFPDPEAAFVDATEEALAEEVADEDEPGNNKVPKKDDAEEKDADPDDSKTEAEPEKLEPEPEPDIRHLVSLTPAGMLWVKKIEMQGDDLLVSALGKDQFSVPMNRVESVSFGHQGMPSTAPVLIWGGYSDEDDEYKKTLDALNNRIPARKMLKSLSKVPDADFKRNLRRARVLLVPEMESFRKKQMEEEMGKAGKGVGTWKDTFKSFLRRGGNIVFLSPTGEALNFFNDSGLGPLRSGGSGGSWEFTAEGKKLGVKTAGPIANVNATHYYRKSNDWKVWGQATGGNDGVVLQAKRVERGWVMVMGTDFYETNENVTETLVKLLEFNGRR